MLFITALLWSLFDTVAWCIFLTTVAEVKEKLETQPKDCLQTFSCIWFGASFVYVLFTFGTLFWPPCSWIGYTAFIVTQALTHLYLGWTSIKTFFSGLLQSGSPARRLAYGVFVLELTWYFMDYIWGLTFPTYASFNRDHKKAWNVLLMFISANVFDFVFTFFVLLMIRCLVFQRGCKVRAAFEPYPEQVWQQVFGGWILCMNFYLIYILLKLDVDLWPETKDASLWRVGVALTKHSLDNSMVLGWLFITTTNEAKVEENAIPVPLDTPGRENKLGILAILSGISAVDIILLFDIFVNTRRSMMAMGYGFLR